ncbi:polysaccharide pyruvyl transferase family protein [Rhizobium sp. NFR12]|uniref:polysaccharide pyruvyl transferase family protein n=1 Tax=Rhizobium sp. NFR12 TaxID=1566261 RepID=UPI0008A74B37|nr:polysaccharide pyruvyl transferase family protein [Rhizobium sp. NFR12]SEH27964.1 Polysaccharide pyruvyl transferase [Rhizobium sp. NFR12]
MYTVDLSAKSFFTKHFPGHNIQYYCLGDIDKIGYREDERHVSYLPLHLHLNEVREADLIVYWGDFLHSKPYWETDLAGWLVRDGISGSRAEAMELIYRALMLEDAGPEILRKVVVYGGTIITVGASELIDQRYAAALRRLVREASGIFFRDALSAAKVAPFRSGGYPLGTDCALLLTAEDFETYGLLTAPEQSGTHLGVFFGRSKWILQPLILARALGQQMETKTVWLPWLRSAPRQLPLARLAGFPATREPPLPQEILRQLMECKAVITDTYHLCVNAWNLGIPAICIGYGGQNIGHTLGDKKKEILYSQYGASDFYVYRETISGFASIPAVARRSAEILASVEMTACVSTEISRHATVSRDRLIASCSSVLASA